MTKIRTRPPLWALAFVLAASAAGQPACSHHDPTPVVVTGRIRPQGRGCIVSSATIEPLKLQVHAGDLAVWTLFNECVGAGPQTVTIRIAPAADPLDPTCARTTIPIPYGGFSSVACFVREVPKGLYLYSIRTGSQTGEGLEGELEIEVLPN